MAGLLDIINNLLEHAKASSSSNSKKRRPGKSKHARRRSQQSTSSESVNDLALITEETMDTALWFTPHPAPLTSHQPHNYLPSNSSPPLKVILDVDSSGLSESGWNFQVNAGAWRRILQNLTANAIKYTDTGGYFRVHLSVRGRPEKSAKVQTVELKCIDSGRGMSQSFLNEGIFHPWRQEDNHSQGTGLGLSLVRGLVEDIGGTIEVQSSKGKGTTFTIVVPLTRAITTAPNPENADMDSKGRLKGLSYEILGFDAEGQDDDRTTEAIDVLRDSLEKSCRDLGLVPHDAATAATEAAGVFITSERMATFASNADLLTKPTLVLCDSVRSSRTAASSLSWAALVSQPLGPRKILRGLLSCLDKPKNTSLEPAQSETKTASPTEEMASPVSVESIFGSPSVADTFSTASLPSRPKLSRNLPSSFVSPASPTNSLSVLLVDDNSVNIALLQKYMKKLGHSYISADNGMVALKAYQDATQQATAGDELQKQSQTDQNSTPTANQDAPPTAQHRRPDVVLMDLMMPMMDGLESTRRIRTHERSLSLKPATIVALTAQASDEAMQEAYSSGVNVFLSKPVGLNQLARVFQDLDADAVGSGEQR